MTHLYKPRTKRTVFKAHCKECSYNSPEQKTRKNAQNAADRHHTLTGHQSEVEAIKL